MDKRTCIDIALLWAALVAFIIIGARHALPPTPETPAPSYAVEPLPERGPKLDAIICRYETPGTNFWVERNCLQYVDPNAPVCYSPARWRKVDGECTP